MNRDVPLERHLTEADLAAELARDVRRGLTRRPKSLPPKYFYDARGSELFEEITRLPEYYPTRAERAILERYAEPIAKTAGVDTLVELGSGSSEKTRLLVDALRAVGDLRRYVPVDVSESALVGAVRALRSDYPDVAVEGVLADFQHHLDLLPREGRRLIAFLGGTIGNLTPSERTGFFADVRSHLGEGEAFLLGTDLVKDADRLVRAYADGAGVTAEFNRNVLRVVNRALAADFVPENFTHVAVWDAEREWIEMRLRSDLAQTVHIRDVDLTVTFEAGEEMRTEISAKFRRDGLAAELADAGLHMLAWWTDSHEDFALSLSVPL